MKKTGAQIVWECLVKEGVEVVFGYPGGANLPLYDAMLDYPIRHVLPRHEQGGVHMADGYARSTGKVGVALLGQLHEAIPRLRREAKLDLRLVPDMTAKGTLELLKAHLARHGFGDIEVNMSGGYDPTETDPDSKLVQAMAATYRKSGVEPLLWPRLAGSWPGVTFTGDPLRLPAAPLRCRRLR